MQDLTRFREAINALAIEQAKQQAHRSSSMLMHISTDGNFRILDMKMLVLQSTCK